MAKLLEFLDRHTARNLFRSSHLNVTLFSFQVVNAMMRLFALPKKMENLLTNLLK